MTKTYRNLIGGDWQPAASGATFTSVSPANPRYQMLIRAWQKLPLPLTRLIGPRIIRSIP